MPWSIVKGGGTCGDDEWAVINDDSGETEGCHETEEAAERQRDALYANEDEDEGAASMFGIRQDGDEWVICDGAGAEVHRAATYQAGVAWIAGQLQVGADAGDPEAGLLPEAWASDPGIAFPEHVDVRDFTQTVWSGRDPGESLLPLMLQTETEMGHFGARLAGFITELGNLGAQTTPTARGRFYDSDDGRAARDLLLGGRRFGVSVDPGELEVEEGECLEEDDDGFCWVAEWRFLAYQIIGLTMTPFPAFPRASIVLDGAGAEAGDEDEPAVAAGGRSPGPYSARLAAPPAEWFRTAEPQLGEPFALGGLGDEWLVEQEDAQGNTGLAMPLTITDDGRVLGHAAWWGQCHIGYAGVCVSPPASASYRNFHIGHRETAEGERIATGVLSANCDHAIARMRAPEAQDHYAHNALGWADVRAANGVHGVWLSGALRRDVTPAQVEVLRAGGLSGDWRDLGRGLEMIGVQAVNTPGFPIARERIAASGLRLPSRGRLHVVVADGAVQTLVGAGMVRRCPECAKRARANGAGDLADLRATLDNMRAAWVDTRAVLDRIDRRTRHLVGPAAEHAAARIRR